MVLPIIILSDINANGIVGNNCENIFLSEVSEKKLLLAAKKIKKKFTSASIIFVKDCTGGIPYYFV